MFEWNAVQSGERAAETSLLVGNTSVTGGTGRRLVSVKPFKGSIGPRRSNRLLLLLLRQKRWRRGSKRRRGECSLHLLPPSLSFSLTAKTQQFQANSINSNYTSIGPGFGLGTHQLRRVWKLETFNRGLFLWNQLMLLNKKKKVDFMPVEIAQN